MSRDLTGKIKRQAKERDNLRNSFINAIAQTPSKSISHENSFDSEFYKEKPESFRYFALKMCGIKEIFPVQLELIDAIFGEDVFAFDNELYNIFIAYWGKGSGKDYIAALIAAYLVYRLMCLIDPQVFLMEKYGCSIGKGDNIDIVNVSINARQAENVYFKKFKNIVRSCKNPVTGENWFVERGVDIEEQKDLQSVEARFPNNINCYSLNSDSYTGEGLNILQATFDEFGGMKPVKAMELYENIESSMLSRFSNKNVGKLILLSYMYHSNDAMNFLIKQLQRSDATFYLSRAATWEVNLLKKKKDFAKAYARNPESAKMKYECIAADSNENDFIRIKSSLDNMFSSAYENPIEGDLITVVSNELQSLRFKDFFRGKSDRLYAAHFDLATGKEKNDAVGFVFGHPEKMKPFIDVQMRQQLATEGVIVDNIDTDEVAIMRKGIVYDLMLQIVAPKGAEVRMSHLRQFVLFLRDVLKFNIIIVTYDGWESRESIQQMQEHGIDSYKQSVDRDFAAWEDWKEMTYQNLTRTYTMSIAHREAREIIIDETGKIDHPEKSAEREVMEGKGDGSKDVLDCIVSVTKTVQEKIHLEPDIFFG